MAHEWRIVERAVDSEHKGRFLVFVYESYYPSGGSGDVRDSFGTYEEARTSAVDFARKYDWVEIFDREQCTWTLIENRLVFKDNS